jgi:hypothetical protein
VARRAVFKQNRRYVFGIRNLSWRRQAHQQRGSEPGPA